MHIDVTDLPPFTNTELGTSLRIPKPESNRQTSVQGHHGRRMNL